MKALEAGRAFEAARASADWQAAWALLSSYSKSVIGTLADFEREQTIYNNSGGATYRIDPPTRDPDLLSVGYLGDVYADVAAESDISRAWLVVIEHPDIDAASAATITLVAAPIGEQWLIWIGH